MRIFQACFKGYHGAKARQDGIYSRCPWLGKYSGTEGREGYNQQVPTKAKRIESLQGIGFFVYSRRVLLAHFQTCRQESASIENCHQAASIDQPASIIEWCLSL